MLGPLEERCPSSARPSPTARALELAHRNALRLLRARQLAARLLAHRGRARRGELSSRSISPPDRRARQHLRARRSKARGFASSSMCPLSASRSLSIATCGRRSSSTSSPTRSSSRSRARSRSACVQADYQRGADGPRYGHRASRRRNCRACSSASTASRARRAAPSRARDRARARAGAGEAARRHGSIREPARARARLPVAIPYGTASSAGPGRRRPAPADRHGARPSSRRRCAGCPIIATPSWRSRMKR